MRNLLYCCATKLGRTLLDLAAALAPDDADDPTLLLTSGTTDSDPLAALGVDLVRRVCDDAQLLFEDVRFTAVAPLQPENKGVATLAVNGDCIAHPRSALRYVGRLARRYPGTKPLDMAQCDALLGMRAGFATPLRLALEPGAVGGELDEAQRAAQLEWLNGKHLPRYVALLLSESEDGEWLGNFDYPTIADYAWAATLTWLRDDGIPGVRLPHAAMPAVDEYLARFRDERRGGGSWSPGGSSECSKDD